MSFESLESSSDFSVTGFCGMSHAVTIVVDAGIRTSASNGTPLEVVFRGVAWQAAARALRMTATSGARIIDAQCSAGDTMAHAPALVPGAWCLVRPDSLVRSWSFFLGPWLRCGPRTIDGTKDHRPRTD